MRMRLAVAVLAASAALAATSMVMADALADQGQQTQLAKPRGCVVGDIPWARYACVLSSLAAVGVIWVGWSMRTLAKNQVELARLIQQTLGPKA